MGHMFINHISTSISIQVKFFSEVLQKGVPRQNTNSSKKCCKKGEVLQKGGVAKRATTSVIEIVV